MAICSASILFANLIMVGALVEPATAPAPADAPALAEGEAPDDDTAEPDAASEPEADAPESAPNEPAPATEPSPLDLPPTTAAAIPPPAPIPPSPPRPIRWRLDIGPNIGGAIVRDPGRRAFAEHRNLFESGISTVFDFRLAEGRFFVGGGVGYQHVGRRDDAYGSQLHTELQIHEPQVLGRLGMMTVEGIDAFARVGVGPSIVRADFDSNGHERARQHGVLPRVDARAGLSLYLPKSWLPRRQAARITAGFELGLGYTWRGKLDVHPTLFQDTDPLRATTAQWGTLSLHGLAWGVGLFVRVM